LSNLLQVLEQKNKKKHDIISNEERKNGKILNYDNPYKKILDGHKDWTEEIVENIKDSDEYFYLKLFQNNIDNIKIINNNFTLNKYQTNCSHSLILELNEETYVINIMSTTMIEYKKIQKTNQIENFKKEYNEDLQKITYNKINDNFSLGYGILPSILKIIIFKQSSKPKNFDYKVFLKESKENYLKSQKLIKERCIIKIDVVLTLLWCSEYRKIYNKIKHKINEISKTNKELKSELFFLEEEPILKQFDSSEELTNFIDFSNKLLQIPVLAYALVAIVDFNDDYFMLYKMSSVAEIIAYYIQSKNLLNRRDLTIKIEKLACSHKAFEKVKKISDRNLNRLLDELFSKPITKKSFFLFIYDYIKVVQSSYIAWHTPKELIIEDYQQLISYLNVIIQVMERKVFKFDYDTKTLSTISTEEVPKSHPQYKPDRETINKFCNFYHLYKEQKFIYNIREATIEQLQILKQLIEFTEKDDCIAFFHYFSWDMYNILHCHIYKDYFNTSDLSRRKIEISYARPILLDKINTKNNDLKLKPFFYKDMVVPFRETITIAKNIGSFIKEDISKLFNHNNAYGLRLGEYILSSLEQTLLIKMHPSTEKQERQRLEAEKKSKNNKLKYLKYKQKYLQLKKLFFNN
jgi:hypothetical protein